MENEFTVYDGEADARFPDVAANKADGRYLVVCQHGDEGSDVYGQICLRLCDDNENECTEDSSWARFVKFLG